jgi:hypothetical protein
MTYKCTIVLLSGRSLFLGNLVSREIEHIREWYGSDDPQWTLTVQNGMSIRQDRVDTIQIEEEE